MNSDFVSALASPAERGHYIYTFNILNISTSTLQSTPIAFCVATHSWFVHVTMSYFYPVSSILSIDVLIQDSFEEIWWADVLLDAYTENSRPCPIFTN